ncbi:hypothetical protein, partial [Bartonella sp. DGB2]|uniref:hypothetical protein n=1 Tax=Bartonella sp. DGB2 TaxID=3388426 RepID=UPI00398FA019
MFCGKGTTRFLGRNFLLPSKSFLYTKDHSQMQQVARAIALSKAQRDQILVTWQTTRPRRFDDQTPLNGSVRFNSALPFQL